MAQIIDTPQGLIEFPDEMSKEEISIILRNKFGAPKKQPQTQPMPQAMPVNPRQRGSTVANPQSAGARAAEFLQQNMEIPMGMGGTLGGVALGAPLGPVGMAVGGIIGGALGSGAGSITSDLLNEEEISYANAIKEAGISLGFDVATLGLGKVLKPAFAPLLKKYMKEGISAEEAVKRIAAEAGQEPAEVGSRESLAASQAILSEQGATLLPTQINAGGFTEAMEKISRLGLFSAPKISDNVASVNKVVSDELNSLFNKNFVDIPSDPRSLGEAAFSIIDAGRRATAENYVNTLGEISVRFGREVVPVKPLVDEMDKFLTSNTSEGIGSTLSKETLSFVNDLTKRLSGNNSMTIPLSSAIELDKLVTKGVSSFSDIKSNKYNSAVAQELTEFSNLLKDRIGVLMAEAAPDTAAVYKQMKKDYSEGMAGILPKINERFINQANNNAYDQLGKLMAGSGNISQIVALKKSLEEAFTRVGKESQNIPGYVSKEDAQKLIKKSFLENTFPSIPKGEFEVTSYASLAKKFSKPAERKRLQVILGDDYPRVKQLVNLMAEASNKPEGNLAGFVVRSKEYETISAALQLAGSGQLAAMGGLAGLAGAGALLLVPRMMANYVTNPRVINKLIAFENTKFKTQEALETAGKLLVDDIWRSLSEEEQLNVIESLNEMSEQQQPMQ